MGQLLECPVCFDIVKPPAWQCCHGHILCGPCRMRSTRCPICRVQLGRRGRCLIADNLYSHLVDEKTIEGIITILLRPLINFSRVKSYLNLIYFKCFHFSDKPVENSKEPQIVATRLQPLRSTNYCSIFKDIFTKKKSRKEYLHEKNLKLLKNDDTSLKIHCPTGKSCPTVTTQIDLYAHLFQSHNLPVTQYYCHPGDAIKVKFRENSIPCITFVHPQTDDGGQLQPCQFFIVKYFRYPNEILCWIWYFGKMLKDFKYRVKLKNREKGICWMGDPVPISTSADEVLKRKEVAWLDQSVKYINIQICKTNSNGSL